MEEQFENGVFGGVEVKPEEAKVNTEFNLPTKVSIWTKIKNFFCQDIKVELTPKQQKVEDEINEFLHQEITWGKVKNFLFQEVKFKK
jgi:hypothetical protein